jgi:RNA polymerase sigma-70 factor (ECF subfamily)
MLDSVLNNLHSDEKLIAKALGGSERCWVRLVRRHEQPVYNYCLRMTRNTSDAMDLMQEVFLAVYRNLPSYRGSGVFRPWMMRIAVNKYIDFLRSRERNPQHYGEEYSDDDTAGFFAKGLADRDLGNPETAFEQMHVSREVKILLQSLPQEQRLVVELKFFQQFTFEEIGYQTGTSVNTVKSRLYAALQKLKDQMENQHVM